MQGKNPTLKRILRVHRRKETQTSREIQAGEQYLRVKGEKISVKPGVGLLSGGVMACKKEGGFCTLNSTLGRGPGRRRGEHWGEARC